MDHMIYRTLGKTGLRVANISLGCVTFGREIGEEESFHIMDFALSCGIKLFDTASDYAEGASEKVIGAWLWKNRTRKKVLLATKLKPPYTRNNILRSCDESLSRLKTSVIDLFQLHQFDESILAGEALETLQEIVTSGKVRFTGVSNFSAHQLQKVILHQTDLGLDTFSSVQNNYNLAVRDADEDLFTFCKKEEIGMISYSPLGAGFLSGKYADKIPEGTRFQIRPAHKTVYFNDKGYKALNQLTSVSKETGYSMVHLALAWVLHRPGITTTLVGARNRAQVDQAVQAAMFNDRAVLDLLDVPVQDG